MRLLNLKFTYESQKKRVAFLDLVGLDNGSITKNLRIESRDCHE